MLQLEALLELQAGAIARQHNHIFATVEAAFDAAVEHHVVLVLCILPFCVKCTC